MTLVDEALPGMPDVDPADVGPAAGTTQIICEQCAVPFDHSGPGRKPKRCTSCRPTRERPATADTAPAGESAPKRPRSVEALEKNIHQQLMMLAMGLVFIDPFDAKVLMAKADQGAKALANLAQTNPAIRRFLEKGVEAAGYGPVLLWGAQVLVPILAHHGMIRGVADPASAQTRGAAGVPPGSVPFNFGMFADAQA